MAFAMNTNKSQGQALTIRGLNLEYISVKKITRLRVKTSFMQLSNE